MGVSYSYMSMVARGHSNMGVKVQARVASALEAPAKVAPAQPACIDREAVWDRMNAHGFSQNDVARRAGISSSNLSQIMNGRNNLSPDVLKRLHGVLFQPTKAEFAYRDTIIAKVMFEFRKVVALGGSRTLYDANREVYDLLRYGVKVQPDVGEHNVTHCRAR